MTEAAEREERAIEIVNTNDHIRTLARDADIYHEMRSLLGFPHVLALAIQREWILHQEEALYGDAEFLLDE